MEKTLRSFLILSLVSSLLITGVSCSKSSLQSQPQPSPTQKEDTSPITPPVQIKSDTEQIINTVLGYISAVCEDDYESKPWDYWHGDWESYMVFLYGEYPVSSVIDCDKSDIHRHLEFVYEDEYDGQAEYDFPKIQENLAVFDVSLERQIISLEESIFRFNLKKYPEKGWKITDIRLIYTDNPLAQEYVS